MSSQRQHSPAQVQDLPTQVPYPQSKVSNGGSQTASTKQNTGLPSQYTQASSQQSRPRLTQSEESRSPYQQSRREETVMPSQGRSERESQSASSRQQSSMQPYVPGPGNPSTYPMSKKPNDRLRTSMAPIGDPGRSIVEGLEEPTKMQRKTQNPQSAATSHQDTSSTTRITSSNRGKPSTWSDSIRPSDSRVPTHMDLLGNTNRTVVEGFLNKKDMLKVEKAQKAEEERKRQK
jgi:hypothetical protein